MLQKVGQDSSLVVLGLQNVLLILEGVEASTMTPHLQGDIYHHCSTGKGG